MCAVYVLLVYGAAMVITGVAGGWWPDRVLTPGLGLAGGVAIMAAISLLGSVSSRSRPTGSRLHGLRRRADRGMLGQIGQAINSAALRTIGRVACWALPFEGLYQQGSA